MLVVVKNETEEEDNQEQFVPAPTSNPYGGILWRRHAIVIVM